MADDKIGYEDLMQEALRGVVRAALQEAASPRGLPGKHHFYITFRTHAPGVVIPEHLRARYPDEMTIVLEHQFWDLEVYADRHSAEGDHPLLRSEREVRAAIRNAGRSRRSAHGVRRHRARRRRATTSAGAGNAAESQQRRRPLLGRQPRRLPQEISENQTGRRGRRAATA